MKIGLKRFENCSRPVIHHSKQHAAFDSARDTVHLHRMLFKYGLCVQGQPTAKIGNLFVKYELTLIEKWSETESVWDFFVWFSKQEM